MTEMTPQEHNQIFGQMAVRLKLITEDQLTTLVESTDDAEDDRPIWELMLELQMLSNDECDLVENKLQAHLKSYVNDFKNALAGLRVDPLLDSVKIANSDELTHAPAKKDEPPIDPDFFEVQVPFDHDPTEPNAPTINLIQKSANKDDVSVSAGTNESESIPISGAHEQTLQPKLKADLPFDPEFFEETIITDASRFDDHLSFGDGESESEKSENSAFDFVSEQSDAQDVDGTNPNAETVDLPPESASARAKPVGSKQQNKSQEPPSQANELPEINRRSPEVKVRLDSLDHNPTINTRYSLTHLCGQGGIGEVWSTEDPNLNREVAFKTFRKDRTPGLAAQRQLIMEAQITGQLEHPNIIPVHELARRDDGTPYYTMKLLRGDTLSRAIKKYIKQVKTDGRVLTLRDMLNVFVDICNAIDYAGSRGIVHRDLKPQNVMLGDFGEVLVLDWGLAIIVDKNNSRRMPVLEDASLPSDPGRAPAPDGEIVGTPAYMAPEQACGKVTLIDHRTDVYGLGGILFAILAGRAPHTKEDYSNSSQLNTRELLQLISEGATPNPKSVEPNVDSALAAICMKAMSRNRSGRYTTAGDLARDINSWLADEPVSCFPEPWTATARRWLRKHKTFAQTAAAAIVLIATISTVSAIVINNAHDREKIAHDKVKAAHERLTIANEQEIVAKKDAFKQFVRARKAIDQSLTGVSDGLANSPTMQSLRIKLLEQAANDYAELAKEKSNDLTIEAEYARSLIRLGDVRRLLFQYDESKASYGLAIERLKKCLPESELGLNLARIHDRIGLLEGQHGKRKEAEESFLLALELLNESELNSDEARQLKATIEGNLGIYLSRATQSAKALDLMRKSEKNWDLLVLESESHEYRENRGKIRIAIGEHLRQTGALVASQTKFEEALDDFELLFEQEPSNADYLRAIADTQLNLAQTLTLMGSVDDEIKRRETAIEDYGELAQLRPDIVIYRFNLAVAEVDLAQTLYRLGRQEPALKAAEFGLTLAKQLVQDSPSSFQNHNLYVYASVALAQIQRDAEIFSDAELLLQNAIETCIELSTADAENSEYHRLLGESRNNLGVVFLLTGDHDRARQSFSNASLAFNKALELQTSPAILDGLAWSKSYLGATFQKLSREKESTAAYKQALEIRAKAKGQSSVQLVNEAWLLITCPEPLRNTLLALELTNTAVNNVPNNELFRTTKAAALYRDGRYVECLKELDQATKLRVGRKDMIGFWRAMALWQQKKNEESKTAFDAALKRMNEVAPGDFKLRTVRDEAAQLLGIDLSKTGSSDNADSN